MSMNSGKPRLVVIGNGMAGIRTLEELLTIAPGHYDITVFGAEPHPNYNRILLSPVLAGEQAFHDIILNPLDWYASNDITLHLGKTVERIDRVRRKVVATDGTEAPYDRLLIATGSTPFILPVPGKDLKGVITYRDIHDTESMIQPLPSERHAVGDRRRPARSRSGQRPEAARHGRHRVVHLAGTLLERQLDATAGRLLQKSLEARGLRFLLNKATSEIVGNEAGELTAVRFRDGDSVPADLVVMAAGIRPNTALAEAAGLHCDRGIVVSDAVADLRSAASMRWANA